jgi:hypothetical protein
MLLQEDVSSGADYYQQDLVDSVFGRGRSNEITYIINVILLQGVAHDFDANLSRQLKQTHQMIPAQWNQLVGCDVCEIGSRCLNVDEFGRFFKKALLCDLTEMTPATPHPRSGS